MAWYRVTFDLDNDQPAGIEPQMAVFERVNDAYDTLGRPAGFAVYDLLDFQSKLFFFFFSPLAAEHFSDFIKSNRHETWTQPLPDGAKLTAGDSTVSP